MSKLNIGLSKLGLKVKKYSPEIFTITGTICIAGGFVLGIKNTFKASEILDSYLENKESITNDFKETTISEEEKDELIKANYVVLIKDMIKVYAPAVGLEILGITCLLNANRIHKKRYVGAVAAYNVIYDTFNKYRDNVKKELGNDMDKHFLYSTTKDKTDVYQYDDNGDLTDKTKKEEVEILPDGYSQYAKFFDSSCRDWCKNADMNYVFLKGQQDYFNDLLHSRGHVFLNEVYDSLGFEHTEAGALVGWVDGNGDSYIDFGFMDSKEEATRRFVNGLEPVVLLDFNVDGIIYDKI